MHLIDNDLSIIKQIFAFFGNVDAAPGSGDELAV